MMTMGVIQNQLSIMTSPHHSSSINAIIKTTCTVPIQYHHKNNAEQPGATTSASVKNTHRLEIEAINYHKMMAQYRVNLQTLTKAQQHRLDAD